VISNLIKSGAVGETMAYLFGEEKCAEVVASGLCALDTDGMADELRRATRAGGREVARPFLHASLSLPPGDEVAGGSDADRSEAWARVATGWIERMGYAGCAWVAVRHSDAGHDHVHIAASRVDDAGRVVPDSYDYYRSDEACPELEREFLSLIHI